MSTIDTSTATAATAPAASGTSGAGTAASGASAPGTAGAVTSRATYTSNRTAATGTTTDAAVLDITHDPDAKRKIVNRLRRAHGQLAAVIDAVEQDSHCRDVVQQLSAVSKALDRAGFLVISNALQECMTDPANDSVEKRGELEKLFLSLA